MTASPDQLAPAANQARRVAQQNPELVHELSRRLNALDRHDQRIAAARGNIVLQQFWRELKEQDINNIRRLKQLIIEEVLDGQF